MTIILKKRPRPNIFIRVFTCREVIAALLLIVIALLTWALSVDRGVLIPYRNAAEKKVNQIPLYDHGDVDSETVYVEDLR